MLHHARKGSFLVLNSSLFFFSLQDIGHSIVEAYSRVLVGFSFSILSRIGDILQEDDLKEPTTPLSNLKFDFTSDVYLAGITETPPGRIKWSLIQQMNMTDGRFTNSYLKKATEGQLVDYKNNGGSIVTAGPQRSKVWF